MLAKSITTTTTCAATSQSQRKLPTRQKNNTSNLKHKDCMRTAFVGTLKPKKLSVTTDLWSEYLE